MVSSLSLNSLDFDSGSGSGSGWGFLMPDIRDHCHVTSIEGDLILDEFKFAFSDN